MRIVLAANRPHPPARSNRIFDGYRPLGMVSVVSEAGILRAPETKSRRPTLSLWKSQECSSGLPRRTVHITDVSGVPGFCDCDLMLRKGMTAWVHGLSATAIT